MMGTLRMDMCILITSIYDHLPEEDTTTDESSVKKINLVGINCGTSRKGPISMHTHPIC
uniref:Uncharacterized protein n=1 Tax=Arion vulgaris TaxID=1028688 RepID=A0A0B7AS19_9EUPU